MTYKTLFSICLIAALVACKHDSEDETTTPPTGEIPVASEADTINLETDGNGCITGNNADIDHHYLIQGMQARNLVWTCLADYTSVEYFAKFDPVKSCYVKAGQTSDYCYEIKPEGDLNIGFSKNNSASMRGIGGNKAFLDYSLAAQNKGSINFYDGGYEIHVDSVTVKSGKFEHTLEPIDQSGRSLGVIPSKTITLFGYSPGDTAVVEMVVRSTFDNNVVVQSHTVKVK